MLDTKNYTFCCLDYSFKYAEGVKPTDFNQTDPIKVTIRGFCVDSDKIVKVCYIREDFSSFNLTKNQLVEKLDLKPVIVSSGLLSFDQNYQKKLDLHSLQFTDKYLTYEFK